MGHTHSKAMHVLLWTMVPMDGSSIDRCLRHPPPSTHFCERTIAPPKLIRLLERRCLKATATGPPCPELWRTRAQIDTQRHQAHRCGQSLQEQLTTTSCHIHTYVARRAYTRMMSGLKRGLMEGRKPGNTRARNTIVAVSPGTLKRGNGVSNSD